MTNSERASYIKGLMDGLELDAKAKETKVLTAVVELLEELCVSLEELEDGFIELAEEVDEIDEDLGELEADFYDLDDDCDCESCSGDFDDEFFEVTCPTCGETLELNVELLEEDSIQCPNCNETLEFDFDDDEDVEDAKKD